MQTSPFSISSLSMHFISQIDLKFNFLARFINKAPVVQPLTKVVSFDFLLHVHHLYLS